MKNRFLMYDATFRQDDTMPLLLETNTVPMFETQIKMELASLKLMRNALRGSDPCR